MFDVSWGEIAVLAGVGLTLLGRKDLPPASRALGLHVGRVVGLLRGARLRADRYATDHHLRKLQNEFRSGLRELDAVKAELAGSMTMGGGVVGDRFGSSGGMGASVTGVDRRRGGGVGLGSAEAADDVGTAGYHPETAAAAMARPGGTETRADATGGGGRSSPPTMMIPLSPRSRSVAAVAEEEWERRGIGFRSVAEGGGAGGAGGVATSSGGGGGGAVVVVGAGGGGGAVMLSNHLRQSLIYDQYERTVREQDEALRSRVEKVRNERIVAGGGK